MTPEDKDKITDSIMEAFDEMAEEGAEEGNITEGVIAEGESEPVTEEDAGGEEAEDEPAEDQPEEEEETEEVEVRAEGDADEEEREEPEEEEAEGEEGDQEAQDEYPPEVQAYLDRHGGDLGKALKTMVEAQQMLARRNTEYGELLRQAQALEAQLAQAQTFAPLTGGLSPEQVEWVEQAVQSETPGAYVQSAVAAGEFDLARAVCDAWGSEGDAYSALRTRQMVDEAEEYAHVQEQVLAPQPEFSRDELYAVLQEQVPDISSYWDEMTEIVNQLGQNHPMVLAAKSGDPTQAAAGLIDLYQVARTRKARVAEARKEHEAQQREQGVAARKSARVSSASSRTSTEEPPRQVRIAPGLTLEELDAALAAE